MSRRREPRDDASDSGRQAQQRFWNGPAGWALSAVAIAGFVGLSLLSPIAALVVAALLVAVELAEQARRLGGPWLVEARASRPERSLVWRVEGRRRSGAAVDEVAGALARRRDTPDLPAGERL